MIHEVSMPALSSTMETGKIVSWLKSAGDQIQKGDHLLVVESDKADMDVESFHSGILAGMVVQEGETVPVGNAIALIASSEAELEQAQQRVEALRQKAASLKPGAVPGLEPGVATGVISDGQSLRTRPLTVRPSTAFSSSEGRILISPRAKRRAQELGLDPSVIAGTGPNGRIVEADIERAAAQGPTVRAPMPTTAGSTPPATDGSPAPEVRSASPASTAAPLGETVPLTTLQAAVVRNMNASLSVPTFRVGYTITTSALDDLYKQVKPKGVTMTALLAKAIAVTLEKHPLVNAYFSESGIHYRADINIAIAVAMEDGGLITPVLQQANRVDLYELSRRWKDLVERARLKQLQPDEYMSGSFTISNLGMFGVDRFDAILPPQQGAILAVGASRPTVVATPDAAITIKPQMQVNLTCDHRVIYGAHAAAFLQNLAQVLEHDIQSVML